MGYQPINFRQKFGLFAEQSQKPLTIRAKQLYHDREEITVFAAPSGTPSCAQTTRNSTST